MPKGNGGHSVKFLPFSEQYLKHPLVHFPVAFEKALSMKYLQKEKKNQKKKEQKEKGNHKKEYSSLLKEKKIVKNTTLCQHRRSEKELQSVLQYSSK